MQQLPPKLRVVNLRCNILLLLLCCFAIFVVLKWPNAKEILEDMAITVAVPTVSETDSF